MAYRMIITLFAGCVIAALLLFLVSQKIKNRYVALFWGGELTLVGGIVFLSNQNDALMKLLGLFLIIFGIVLSIVATLRRFPAD